MYSRTNVNPILNSINNQTAITTGASIIYTQTFDELRDLFRSSRDRKGSEPQPIDLNAEALKEDDGGE